jgi:DNA-binding transcriptional LysR family regulator
MPMGLNSFGLDAFYICAQEKNFTRAAERLYLTQSALSQRIKNLEIELGVTLFIRDRIGVRLTEPGEALLRYCHTRAQLEQELEGEVAQKQNEVTGFLRVAGFSSVMRSIVLPACQQVTEKNSRVQINLFSKELFELPELLKNSTVDFILLDHVLDREGVRSVLLGYEVNIRIRKKGAKFNGSFIDHDERDETTIKYLKLKSGAKIRRHFAGDIYSLIDGVRLGIGDAIMPKHLISDLRDIEIIDEKETLKNPVYLHFYDHPVQTKLFKAFLETIKKTAKEILMI